MAFRGNLGQIIYLCLGSCSSQQQMNFCPLFLQDSPIACFLKNSYVSIHMSPLAIVREFNEFLCHHFQATFMFHFGLDRIRGTISNSLWMKIGGNRETSGNQNHSLVNLIVHIFKTGYADSCPMLCELLWNHIALKEVMRSC